MCWWHLMIRYLLMLPSAPTREFAGGWYHIHVCRAALHLWSDCSTQTYLPDANGHKTQSIQCHFCILTLYPAIKCRPAKRKAYKSIYSCLRSHSATAGLMKWWGTKMSRTQSPAKATGWSTAASVSHKFKILLITSLSVSNLELNSTELLINRDVW